VICTPLWVICFAVEDSLSESQRRTGEAVNDGVCPTHRAR